jgi:hypothetical protein
MSKTRDLVFVGIVLVSVCVLGYLGDYSTIYILNGSPRYVVKSVEWGIMDYRVSLYDSSSQAYCGGVWTLSFFQIAVTLSVVIALAYLVRFSR